MGRYFARQRQQATYIGIVLDFYIEYGKDSSNMVNRIKAYWRNKVNHIFWLMAIRKKSGIRTALKFLNEDTLRDFITFLTVALAYRVYMVDYCGIDKNEALELVLEGMTDEDTFVKAIARYDESKDGPFSEFLPNLLNKLKDERRELS